MGIPTLGETLYTSRYYPVARVCRYPGPGRITHASVSRQSFQMLEQTEVLRTDGQTEGWTEPRQPETSEVPRLGQTKGWMDGRTEGWMELKTQLQFALVTLPSPRQDGSSAVDKP
jgi:hypothetical protein